jgi:methyltransferase
VSAVRLLLALVALQRLGELLYAARNTQALRRRGAVEFGRWHYPLLVALHAAWLATQFLVVPHDAPLHLVPLAFFLLLQGLRLWIVASLGPYWTTRIISLPDAPLVRRGPYAFLRHPNYALVAIEIPLLPLAFGAWRIAVGFGLLNLLMLAWRIRIEEQALAPRRHAGRSADHFSWKA